mgnify:CR=1 FL=1
MLMMSAGFSFAGMPATVPPDAHVMASAMSDRVPPQRPSTRTGSTVDSNARPAMPTPLLVASATVPATCVPCQELSVFGEPV